MARRQKQQPFEKQFARVLFWLGSGIIIVFLIWTFAMVMLEAAEQWRS